MHYHLQIAPAWNGRILIFPFDIQDDYEEAAAIAIRSPRGAADVLRHPIQNLCQTLR